MLDELLTSIVREIQLAESAGGASELVGGDRSEGGAIVAAQSDESSAGELAATLRNRLKERLVSQKQKLVRAFAHQCIESLGFCPNEESLEKMAEESIRAIDSLDLSQDLRGHLEAIARSELDAQVKPPLPWQEGIQPIPSAIVLKTSVDACTQAWQWQNLDGLAVFTHQSPKNQHNVIEHYISSPGDIQILPWLEAQKIIDNFGFTTAKLQLLMAAHTKDCAQPWREEFVLKGTDILKRIGWDKRTDLSQGQKLNEVAKHAWALSCVLVRSTWEEGRKGNRVQISVETSRMWEIAVRGIGQLDLFDSNNTNSAMQEPSEIYITIRPGLWTRSFLNQGGWLARQAFYQFSYLSEKVLEIDPYHHEIALRLAIQLTLTSSYRSGRYRVGTLLEKLLPPSKLQDALTTRQRGHSLKKQWDTALLVLERAGWTIRFEEDYPEVLRPHSQEKNPHKYWQTLINAHLNFTPPSPIPELLEGDRAPENKLIAGKAAKATKAVKATTGSMSRKAADKPIQTAPSLSGSEIRKARKQKKWSQSRLAGMLGIGQRQVSRLETGDATTTPALEKQLRQILDV